jgi:precorrin-3B synthase
MPSGDGLLLRLHLPFGAVPPELARGIALSAQRFGNGLVDLTRHGNLQLRGVSEATLPALSARLRELLPSLTEDQPEAARNIVASPLAGLDPQAICDIRPIVVALENQLTSDPALRALPAKFSFVIDDGSRLGLADIAADIRFEADRGGGGSCFAIALGGKAGMAVPIGACAAADLPDIAILLARAFLSLRGEDEAAPRRMAELVERVGGDAIAREIGGLINKPARPEQAPSPATGEGKRLIGFRILGNDVGFAGVGALFGRLSADQLGHLAKLASDGNSELRLTPWRAVLIAPVARAFGETMQRSLAGLGLITRADDARLAVAACPGAPACANASVATREDALSLALLAQRVSDSQGGIVLHLSGCLKGCAKSDATPVTLVGRDGRYDVVLNGRPGDAPAYSALTAKDVKALLGCMVLPFGKAAMAGNGR